LKTAQTRSAKRQTRVELKLKDDEKPTFDEDRTAQMDEFSKLES